MPWWFPPEIFQWWTYMGEGCAAATPGEPRPAVAEAFQ